MTGPARVFTSEKATVRAIKDGRINRGDVIVLICRGPAGAGMEELDAVVCGVGLEAGEELPRLLPQHARGPPRGGGRLVVEVADGELAEHDQVMVPDEATVGPGPHGVAALVRQRPVANGVA